MAYDPKGKTDRQLHEDRQKIICDARKYHAENEGNWTAECEERWKTMLNDASDIGAAIDRRKALSDLAASSANQPKFDAADVTGGNKEQPKSKITLRVGNDENGKPLYASVDAGRRGSDEYRRDFNRALAGEISPAQFAALQSDSATQAGYLLASEQLAAGILKNVDDLVFIRQYARIIPCPEAHSLGIRRRTSKMSTFGWSSELTVSTEDSALAYGKKVLTPHPLTGMIRVSRDLLRRSSNGAEAEVMYEMGRDAAEAMEQAYLTGSGSNCPLGVFTASADGISTNRDVSTGSTTAITADSLIDAKMSLKSQYRMGQLGPLRWLFHRDAVKQIMKLKDTTNQYLYIQGLRFGEPDSLLGLPIDESERAPNTFTTGQYVGLLANWNYYVIADALDMEMQILYERYAETNQVGYIGRIKTDGMPVIEEAFARLKTA